MGRDTVRGVGTKGREGIAGKGGRRGVESVGGAGAVVLSFC